MFAEPFFETNDPLDSDSMYGLLARPAWQAQAACRNSPLDWFPCRGGDVRGIHDRLRAICGSCPVREDCLNYAIDNNEEYGFWGGLHREQRDAVRRQRKRALVARCGTEAGYHRHMKRERGGDGMPCAACRQARASADRMRRRRAAARDNRLRVMPDVL